jgi:hypothetical protein
MQSYSKKPILGNISLPGLAGNKACLVLVRLIDSGQAI